MYAALACVHKCFTLKGHLKSANKEWFWSSAEHIAQAVTWKEKYIYAKAKIAWKIYYASSKIASLHDMF